MGLSVGGSGVCLGLVDVGFAANHGITMGDAHAFSRPSVTITAGDSVTWTSQTSLTPHNVTCSTAPSAAGCFTASPNLVVLPFFSSTFVLPNSTNPTYFRTAGTYTYRCTLHAGMNGTVTVNTGALHHFTVAAPATATAGTNFNVTVTARDQFNNLVAFNGSVQLSINNPHPAGGELPATVTLSAGSGSFSVTPKRSGSRTITVTSGSVSGSDTLTVNPAAASKFGISAPGSISANATFQVTVSARDAFDNLVTGYSGTVHFTSSDPAAILPADNTLSAGTRNFNVTLRTAGPQVITVTDTVTPAITSSASVNVAASCAISFSNPAPVNTPVIGLATLYPSNIVVSGLKQTINGMSITLTGLLHTQPADLDVLLVGPHGQKMIIMSDSGSVHDVSNLSFTLSDAGTASLPLSTILTSGTFKPTNQTGADSFASPAPAAPYSSPAPTGTATFASVFDGTDPNGTWSLYVVDDLETSGTSGGFTGGWSISFDPPPNTFCNLATMVLPNSGTAAQYPSQLTVSGIDGTLRSVSLRLDNLTKAYAEDLDVLLVSPAGASQKKMVVLSDPPDVSFPPGTANVVMTLDDSGVFLSNPLASGIFMPINNVSSSGDFYPSPAPAAPYSDPATGATLASTFGGINPNGTWNLYIVDDELHPPVFPSVPIEPDGVLRGGWALTLDVILNTSITLDANINPSVVGQTVTLTANVSSSGPVPTGTVTFKVGGVETATSPLEDGTAVLFIVPIAGSYNFTATYNGDTNFHPSTSNAVLQVVNPGPTATAVVASANPITFGQAVTFTATVSESTPYALTGTVTFLDGSSILGTSFLNGSGVATLTTSAVGGGSRSITAVYNGDANFAPSTSPVLTQTVLRAPSSTTLVASPNPSAFGSSVTFTATVSGGALGIPTGTVTFKDGAATIGSANLNESGVATFSTSALSVGAHDINAVFDGDDDFGVSTSGTVSQTVDRASSSVSLISFLNPADFGQEITFRADVSSPLSTLPTGVVFFKDGPALLGSASLTSGTAQFSTSALAAGNHNITAGYDGDSNFKGNISSILVQEVIGLPSVTTLTANLNPAVFGPAITFTATVTAASGGPASGGTVTFFKNGEAINTGSPLNSVGVATGGAQLPAGQYSITAIYNGGPVFAGSTSNTITQTVNPSTARFLGLVSPSKFFFRFREPIGFQVQVISNTGGLPTGTVILFEGDTSLGSATLDGAGRATIFVPGLSVGEHELRVVYDGDSNFPEGAESDAIIYNRSPRPR